MAEQRPPITIADYPVEIFQVGRVELGHITLADAGITVIFQMPKAGGAADCLGCKISNISSCAKDVCPEVKEKNPDASCQPEIEECVEEECRDECGENSGASDTGYGMIIDVP